MSDRKKDTMFAKLAEHHAKSTAEGAGLPIESPPEPIPPSPALPERPSTRRGSSKAVEPSKGKRGDPDYCQANAYVPKSVRKAVDRALIDIDGLDYSSLITELLRKWLKSKGLAE